MRPLVPGTDAHGIGDQHEQRLAATATDGRWSVPSKPSLLGAAAFALLLAAYGVRTDMSALEMLRLVAGAAVLWGPFALVIDTFLRREIDDGASRVALAFVGSYAFTSTLFFVCSVAGVPKGLYVVQAVGVVSVLVHRRRTGGAWRVSLPTRPPNWFLLCLIALALFTTAPYTKVADVSADGTRRLRISSDSLYYVSNAYEIDRHLPPNQDPLRAGTPARSYHLLPHVTTVLLARATGQPDMLRAQALYHLTVITVAMSALFYALGKVLTRRRLGGYALVALLYPLALIGRPFFPGTTMIGDNFTLFYFTPMTQMSSMLDPVAFGSWQTYSGVLVMLGLVLAVAVISLRAHSRLPCHRLLVYAGLIAVTLSRFRIQAFLVGVPAFVLVVLVVWMRNRLRSTLVAGLGPLLLAIPLVMEAGSSHYRPGSSGIRFGLNNLAGRADTIFGGWPFSRTIYGLLDRFLSGSALAWTWQAVCMTGFVLLNMIGPLGLVGLMVYLRRRGAWSTLRPFTMLILAMAGGSTLVAIIVTSDFDPYSLAGQAPYLTPWLLFGALSAAAVAAYSFLQNWLRLPRTTWLAIGMVLTLAGAWAREAGSTSLQAVSERQRRVAREDDLNSDRWATFEWIRNNTPNSAVMLSSEYLPMNVYFSGLGGRATYLEGLGDINDFHAQRLYGDDRFATTQTIWETRDPELLCALVRTTPATYLVEFANLPLAASSPPCLVFEWSGPGREARIWRILDA